MLTPVEFRDAHVRILDQRRLPQEEVWLKIGSVEELSRAIETLSVRGAPAIGIAAAYGCALAARQAGAVGPARALAAVRAAAERLARTRPTAVNLFWALERMRKRAEQIAAAGGDLAMDLLREAEQIHAEDRAACEEIGRRGAELLPQEGGVLTHCNAGALATGGFGTALGVIRAAVAAGKRIHVYADETRPLLQGARLTAWELLQDGIPVTLICDNMAAHLMRLGRIQACVVGADRIARNGDTANKIGTYGVAVLARHHNIPILVAAPWSTVDMALPDGSRIPIEERDGQEVRSFQGSMCAPPAVPVVNPAFDVTPASLIQAIVTERGVARAPDLAGDLQRLSAKNLDNPGGIS
ncbi:MAG: S-methyl-5-thioribose-1-phosphate isomerase [Myxococcales bacterium]|nr:S-methyl-5-thioribose-1-phosphate isomerase [Myxococcales bacterium]